MKINLWNKKFIEFDGVHDLSHEVGWFTRVLMGFKKNTYFFHQFYLLRLS